jgi:hypothetical protein
MFSNLLWKNYADIRIPLESPSRTGPNAGTFISNGQESEEEFYFLSVMEMKLQYDPKGIAWMIIHQSKRLIKANPMQVFSL